MGQLLNVKQAEPAIPLSASFSGPPLPLHPSSPDAELVPVLCSEPAVLTLAVCELLTAYGRTTNVSPGQDIQSYGSLKAHVC